MSQPELEVSVVLPVFNERGHLTTEIERIRTALEASPYSFEIVVIDDGSTDGSSEELVALRDIRLVRLSANHGTGVARRIGTQLARGSVVVWTDVDMSYPNDEIPALLKELEGFDQVVGARTSEQGTARLLRGPVKWTLRKLAGYLMGTPIPDLNSGFRAFRRDVALQFLDLLPDGFSCVTTMTMAFLSNSYSVSYTPIEYRPRAGRSKFHWWRDTKLYATQIVRMVMSWNPLKVFLPVGVVLLVTGTGKLALDWATKDFHLATNTLLILFAGLQTLSIGFLADLVVRLNRPRRDVPPADLLAGARFTP
jgi:glycosyltransferase involved in cell wall biosynthesis